VATLNGKKLNTSLQATGKDTNIVFLQPLQLKEGETLQISII
jgi:hypothetical protein